MFELVVVVRVLIAESISGCKYSVGKTLVDMTIRIEDRLRSKYWGLPLGAEQGYLNEVGKEDEETEQQNLESFCCACVQVGFLREVSGPFRSLGGPRSKAEHGVMSFAE